MKKSRFSEHQILSILKEVESGQKVQDICRHHGISDATYYKWKSKYRGMEASDVKKLQNLEGELLRYKQQYMPSHVILQLL
jgi:putative transposase